MEPLIIALVAGAGYLLLKGKAGAASASSSPQQLVSLYAGKVWRDVPSDVLRRLQQYAASVRASGQKKVKFLVFLSPEENASLPADWHYLTGRAPDFSLGDWGGPASAQGGSPPGNLVSRVTWIDDKVSGFAAVTGAIGSLAGGVVRNTVLPGSGGLPL